MNYSMLANAGLAAGFFLVFALPGLFRKETRGWVRAVAVIALIDAFATLLPLIDKQLQVPGLQYNWLGKGISIVAMLIVSLFLIATRRLTAAEIGLTARQAPGTAYALVVVILPYLILLAGLTATMFGNSKPPSHETLAYQATMPGLAEELSYRGLQLAIFNRVFTRRFRLLGADLGYGAIAVSIVFGLLHSLAFDKHMQLQFSLTAMAVTGSIGFILAWLRARTGSLVMPVLVHNMTNLVLELVPKIF